jgi:hypothetical protein
MSDDPNGSGPRPADYSDSPVDPADIASAGRSCSAILILFAAILLVLCLGIALRWAAAR